MKKLISLLLAVSIIAGLGVTAYASSSSDYATGVTQSIGLNAYYDTTEVNPKAELLYPLTADMFEWNSGTVRGKEAVTTSQLRNISVAYTVRKGADVIKNISIVTATSGGMKTACVKVEFLTEHVGVTEKEFDITMYLRRSRTRVVPSELNITGKFTNKIVYASDSDSYVDLTGGKVLIPTDYIKSIELGAGDGAILRARVYADRRYYATAEDKVTSDDDAMTRKYPSIVGIYTLKTVNLSSPEVLIEGYNDCYVYDKNGKYLGETNSWLAYSDKYYVTDKRVDMGGGVVSNSSSSGSAASPSSSSTPSSGSGTTSGTGTKVTADSVTKLTQTAVSTAKSSGSKVATVRVKDALSISAEAVSAMVKTATASGMSARLNADTMNGSTVAGRLTLSPTASTKLSNDINLGVYVDASTNSAVKTKFTKWYKNNLEVISLAHKGSFGMNVNVAAKIKLTNLDTNKLYLYAYNKTTNTFAQIKNPNCVVDKSGYLHFTTSTGGEIIISEGALTRS
ncbi:MAG: hypothetical protein LBV27_03230 [Oscillospiraceae bacterium]|jgi:hypothetical protein|nr:hypothetical protein [Oscillospiraceae bacterium]